MKRGDRSLQQRGEKEEPVSLTRFVICVLVSVRLLLGKESKKLMTLRQEEISSSMFLHHCPVRRQRVWTLGL